MTETAIIFPSYPRISAGIVPDVESAPLQVVIPHQTHSCNIAVLKPGKPLPPLDDTDAIISMQPGVAIGVRTADCVPLLLYAPDINAVAAVHAGWKGSLGGIVSNTATLLLRLGASPDRIQAAFGPCICGRCYEVSLKMADTSRDAGFGECITNVRNLDLEDVNRRRLIYAGIPVCNIQSSPHCTLESPSYPSWRRTQTTRRLLTWIKTPD